MIIQAIKGAVEHVRDVSTGRLPGGMRRSPKWASFARALVKKYGSCSACMSKKRLEVHHIEPFHLAPHRELDRDNAIVLCRRCHLLIGHMDDFQMFNPHVERDAAFLVSRIAAYGDPARFTNTVKI